jgi:hypothetical protein
MALINAIWGERKFTLREKVVLCGFASLIVTGVVLGILTGVADSRVHALQLEMNKMPAKLQYADYKVWSWQRSVREIQNWAPPDLLERIKMQVARWQHEFNSLKSALNSMQNAQAAWGEVRSIGMIGAPILVALGLIGGTIAFFYKPVWRYTRRSLPGQGKVFSAAFEQVRRRFQLRDQFPLEWSCERGKSAAMRLQVPSQFPFQLTHEKA